MRCLALCLALVACGGSTPSPAPADAPADTPVVDVAQEAAVPCGGLCGAGTVCEGGRCVMQGADAEVDSPTAMEAAAPDVVEEPGLPPDVSAPDAGMDVAAEAGGCGDTMTDPANCGMCGNRCSFPNATATCVRGLCGIGTCATGFGDCDGRNDNGCETVLSEASNCGACNNRCPDMRRCVGGQCDGACPSDRVWCFDVCAGLAGGRGFPANHCGACGVRCALGEMCSGGRCINPCPAGQSYCDGNVDLRIACSSTTTGRIVDGRIMHCGRCGAGCGLATEWSCEAGVCRSR